MALLIAGTAWSCGTGTAQSPREREPVIGGPCENCEDVFVEMLPQHIHMHIIEPGRGTYWISDINFTDDPRLTVAQRRELASGRGGSGLVTPAKRDRTWWVTRDIVLGEGIPGYPE
jgi:hypothetical protein